MFHGQEIYAGVWAFREQDGMMLSCDLYSGDGSTSLPITIETEGKVNYYLPDSTGGAAEADVPDMVEALHLMTKVR